MCLTIQLKKNVLMNAYAYRNLNNYTHVAITAMCMYLLTSHITFIAFSLYMLTKIIRAAENYNKQNFRGKIAALHPYGQFHQGTFKMLLCNKCRQNIN